MATTERHPIPRNIMDVEFKLFGNLTPKQFGSIAICCFFALFIYLLNLPWIISYPLIALFLFLGVGLAFLKVNGVPFARWLQNFIVALFSPQRKVWKKETRVPQTFNSNFQIPKAKPKDDRAARIESILESSLERREITEKANSYESQILSNIDRYLDNPSTVPLKVQQINRDKNFSYNKKSEDEVKTEIENDQPAQDRTGVSNQNFIFGKVTLRDGSSGVGYTIVVKDSKFYPVRQAKTNSNGIFQISTPLEDGRYSVSVVAENHSFASHDIKLEGGEKYELNITERN